MPLKNYTQFPDVIDKTGMILLLADPVTGALFKIDQSLLSAIGSVPDLQAVTDVGLATTNAIQVYEITIAANTTAGGKISANNLTANNYIELPEFGGGMRIMPVSINGEVADNSGNITLAGIGGTPDLQAVTDAGFQTTTQIWSNGFNLYSAGVLIADLSAFVNGVNKGGAVSLKSVFNSNFSILTSQDTLSTPRNNKLPDASGTLAISVNGNVADANGNITISTGGSTPSLQAVTNVDGNSTNVISVTSSDFSQQVIIGNNAEITFNNFNNAAGVTLKMDLVTDTRVLNFPDATGTLALLSDITGGSTPANFIQILQGLGGVDKAASAGYPSTTSSTTASDKISLTPLYINAGTVVTGIHFITGLTQPNYTASSTNALALYSYDNTTGLLTLRGQTANDSNIFKHLPLEHVFAPLGTPYTVPASGTYYTAILTSYSASVVVPTAMASSMFFSGVDVRSDLFGLPNSGKYYAFLNTQTSFPSSFNISTASAFTQGFWMAVY